MDSLTWEGDLPQLRSPVLVCAFRGWNDAAAAASTALAAIADSLDAELIARIDPEEFFDFQSTRPTITLERGPDPPHRVAARTTSIAARVPSADRDLVLLDGTEPNLRWRTFSETIATAADALGVEMVITLGALIAEVSHTLPVPITGLASEPGAGRGARPASAPTTRARPGSSASSTTSAARSASTPPRSGRRCPTTSPPSPTRRRRWPCCAGSRG